MLRLFQVNEGRYVDVEGELTPNTRVGEVCEGVCSVEREDGVVLMVADGRQMEQNDLVAAYAAGMESKPIFVFYQSYLSSPAPPSLSTHIKSRPDLERGLAILNQKPSPSLFQKLPPLAKQLSEYSSGLFNTYLCVSEECDLQISGWTAVLRNCKRIISVYQKHQHHFSRVVDSFLSSRPNYIELIRSFPEQLKLLQQLPVPSYSSSSSLSSLYDWISTHDEKNSLVDLCSECEKALAQAEEGQLRSALEASQRLLDSCSLDSLEIREEGRGGGGGEGREEEGGGERIEKKGGGERREREGGGKRRGGEGGGEGREAKKAAEISQLQIRMMENIQSTSQRAMRSGDGGTVADLSVSHHKTLQLMRQHCRQLEEVVRSAETRKMRITLHIHKSLRVVTDLQMKINESNSVLVFLYETLKLAKKRFEVLDQVCSCGEVLGKVVSEVERRQTFNHLFTERVMETAKELKTAQVEEKQRRHTFTAAHHHHFLLSLFPQLSHRLPDATCRLNRVPDTSDTTDLSLIKRSLPPQYMPPSISTSFPLSLSHSHIITGSTPHLTSHPHMPPVTTSTTRKEGMSAHKQALVSSPLLEETSKLETSKLTSSKLESSKLEENSKFEKLEAERNSLATRVQDLQDEVTTINEAKEMESQGFEYVRDRGSIVQEREKEFSAKIQQLQSQVTSLATERDLLLREADARRRERETEKREFSERLRESDTTRRQLAASLDDLQRERTELERQLRESKEESAEKERHWGEERDRFAARETAMVLEMEKERRKLHEMYEKLKYSNIELTEQFEKSEKMVSDQKSVLLETRAEVEGANDARLKLNDECKKLEDSLRKKSSDMDCLQQQNMQWRGEAEEKERDIESLKKTMKEMNEKFERLNNDYQSLSSENEQLKSGLTSDTQSMGSDGSRSDREQLRQRVSTESPSRGSRSDREQLQGHLSSDLQSRTEGQRSDDLSWIIGQSQVDLQRHQAEISQLKEERGRLNSQKEKLESELSRVKLHQSSQESRVTELTRHSEELESRLIEAERQREELRLQVGTEKTKFASDVAKLNCTNQHLQSQCQDQQTRCDKLGSQLAHVQTEYEKLKIGEGQLKTECEGLQIQEEQLKTRSTELEAENKQLQTQIDTITYELEDLRRVVRETEEKAQSSCVECENHLENIETLTRTRNELQKELERSEYRHQQAQKAYASSKAQQEQLRLRLVAVEERKSEDVASKITELRGREIVERGEREGELGCGGVARGRDSSGGEEEGEDDGWVLEGGKERRNPQDEVKRLRTELAVERSNRSLLAEELQQVGKERDEYMQKFMEVERDLRSHHRALSESVMTASSSSSPGASATSRGASGPSKPQKGLSLTISNLQVDDVALFCVDSFNNYLALCVDGKTYYLNHSCVSKFTDAWQSRIKPPFKKKLLIGRVTRRLHVEVRKEDNRLHVPVGTRLYKLEAVELNQDTG